MLRNHDNELLEDIGHHIEFVDNPYLQGRNQHLHTEAILNSVVEKRVMRHTYLSPSTLQGTQRDIEPVGIYTNGSYWYLIAWYRLRRGYRNFRIDRMQSLEPCAQRFTIQHPFLKHFMKEAFQEKAVHKAVIRLDKTALCYLGDQHYYNGFVSQTDRNEQVEMVFLTPSLSGLAHWFLLLGEAADVVAPEELKQMGLEKTEKIRDRIFKVC